MNILSLFPLFVMFLLPHPSTLLLLYNSCEDFFLTTGLLAGEKRVLLRMDSYNLSVVCRLDQDTGEVLTTINHTIMDFIKVDGFQVKNLFLMKMKIMVLQDAGSFFQIVHYDLTEQEISLLMRTSRRQAGHTSIVYNYLQDC